jgi:hypothetical protein
MIVSAAFMPVSAVLSADCKPMVSSPYKAVSRVLLAVSSVSRWLLVVGR